MPITQQDLHSLIKTAFPDSKIEIIDLVGDNDHYSVKIIDKSFAGKSRIQQHRMVHQALDECLKGQLHAMQLKTASD